MARASVLSWVVLGLLPVITVAAEKGLSPSTLSVATIVEHNITARGGSAAWKTLQTLSWSGKMDAGGNNQRLMKVPGMAAPPPQNPNAQVQLPFTLEMKRGRKTRFELQFNGQTAVQVYDGAQGWKKRPFLNRNDVDKFSADELKIAADQADIDGQLMDYAAKGTKIDVDGLEQVEGKPAYRLKLTLKSGRVIHDWVDAKTFLEVKLDGEPRRLDGRMHSVAVYLRDYRAEGGLQIPHVLETIVQGVPRTEKILIEKVTVNPRLDDSRFAKPS